MKLIVLVISFSTLTVDTMVYTANLEAGAEDCSKYRPIRG